LRDLIPKRVKGTLKGAVFNYRKETSWLRLMPDFLVIGAARSGTTSLYRYLLDHPAIGAASRKEIQYFSMYYWRGIEWYRAHFPTTMHKMIVNRWRGVPFRTGEASPYYLFHPLAPARIADLLPEIKLLVVLRNPIDRAFSHYQHEVALGVENLSFEEAIEQEPQRLEGEVERIVSDPMYPGFRYQHFSYVSRGIYHRQLERWFLLLPRESFLILGSERFFADPQAAYTAVLSFLGLPPARLAEFPRHNPSKPSSLNEPTREKLGDYFASHNERLYRLLGEDFDWAPR